MPGLPAPAYERLSISLEHACGIGVLDPVVPIACAPQIGVEPRPTFEAIIAGAALECVISGFAPEQIVLGPPGERIDPVSPIRARPSRHRLATHRFPAPRTRGLRSRCPQ